MMGNQTRTNRGVARIFGLVLVVVSVCSGWGFAAQPGADGSAEAGSTQGLSAAVDPRFESPRATMRTFLEAMQRAGDASGSARDAAFSDAIACVEGLSERDRSAAENAVSKLLLALNKIELVDYGVLPDRASLGWRPIREFVFYPRPGEPRHEELRELTGGYRVVLAVGDDGSWRFTARTAENVNALWLRLRARAESFGQGQVALTLGLWVRSMVPGSLQGELVLGLEVWQWIGLALLVFLALLVDLLTRTVMRRVWMRLLRRIEGDSSEKVIRRSVRPFGTLLGGILVLLGLNLLDLPETPSLILTVAARVVVMLSAVLAAYRLADVAGEFLDAKAKQTATKIDDLLIPLVRKTVKIVVTAMGVIYIAESMDIEILPLLTGLGIGGLAFAFAAKDTIENFFGSIAVIADRPFEVGDWVVIGETEGTVEELGFRSTRIRTFYNSLITVPNATLVRATVDNYGRRRYRRFKTTVGLKYGTPPEKIEAFCSGVRELIRLHPYTRKDYYHVWLNGFGPHSLDVLIYMFHECPEWATELRERHRFMLDVVRLAGAVGVEFAFPTQTLHLVRDAGGSGEAPAAPGKEDDARAVARGCLAARELTHEQVWREKKPDPVMFQPRVPFAPRAVDSSKTQTIIGTESVES